ncbi:MAG: aldo/keto reductase [Firmicutes bacterium]|nr:aldo/keto reductase [Bacillota bacterium]
MIHRDFKKINVKPSLLGFGCMRLPCQENGRVDVDKTREMLHYAHSQGVNYFDTAPIYHNLDSERVLGIVLNELPRDSFYFATKMPGWSVKTLDDAKRIFDKQLARCKMDYFDFYLCHALSRSNVKVYQEFLLDFLVKKQQEGLIKRLGFSFHDDNAELKPIINMYDWEFCLLQLNYYDWHKTNAQELYDMAKEKDLPIIVMEPVRGGSLATLNSKARDILTTAKPENSVASWALRFLYDLPQVSSVISGMSNMDQLKDNLKHVKNHQPLTNAEHETIKKALTAFAEHKFIPCTNCNYCNVCHNQINIGLVFTLYNEYVKDGDLLKFHNAIKRGKSNLPEFCNSCKACVKHCPQKIDIPLELLSLKV